MNVMGESIQDIRDKFKSFASHLLANDQLFLAILLVTIAVTAFGLGRLAERAATTSIKQSAGASVILNNIDTMDVPVEVENETEDASATEQYVASKSGSKYHYPWCPGAKQMKEENKIYFNSRPAAEAAGYTPAANCKGL